MQGTPDSIDKSFGETWWFGASRVNFRNGRVHEWSMPPGSFLKVALAPSNDAVAEAATGRGYFTLGSAKDEIIALQGVPTAIDRSFGETWWFGAARIRFQKEKVSSWSQSAGNASPLKVRLLPKEPAAAEAARAQGAYGPRAMKDEVLGVEGTPDEIDLSYGETWRYGPSTIKFRNGRVEEWNSSPSRPLGIALSTAPTTTATTQAVATLPGFIDMITNTLDQATNEICLCTNRACAEAISSGMIRRGVHAGAAYTENKSKSKELEKFFREHSTDSGGAAFAVYIKKHRAVWFAAFKARLDPCLARLPPQ